MIHQVRAAKTDVDRLRQVLTLQLSLLKLAAAESSLSKSSDRDKGKVEQHLEATYGERAGQVADWITRKPKLFDTLNQFAAHSDSAEKQTFVNGLSGDVDLLFNPRSARLTIAFTNNMPAWQKAAADFCRYFYELFGQKSQGNPVRYGFPAYLLDGLADGQDSYSRWDFIDGFTRQNPTLYLCAVCDATAYRATINSRAYTSVEHFFPKSTYPHLAIHPYNLIPICTFCNSGAARSENPLDYCSEELGISELLLPYQEQQPGLSGQAYIAVQGRNDDSADDSHPLVIRIRPASGCESESLIANFERIYHIEERWNADLDQIDQHVFRRITQFLQGDVQLGNDLSDANFVIGRLKLLMALTSQENLGQDPFGFAAIWLIKHHIDSIAGEREEAAVYQALRGWAEGQQAHWESLQAHVVELFKRVPEETADKEL
jgi:hypothetical protein